MPLFGDTRKYGRPDKAYMRRSLSDEPAQHARWLSSVSDDVPPDSVIDGAMQLHDNGCVARLEYTATTRGALNAMLRHDGPTVPVDAGCRRS